MGVINQKIGAGECLCNANIVLHALDQIIWVDLLRKIDNFYYPLDVRFQPDSGGASKSFARMQNTIFGLPFHNVATPVEKLFILKEFIRVQHEINS
mmetsp:Transcript_1306/g.2028  ORF Transcript_1306/g.2028 Transcript_1306/m.2028 type:complete len:96 (-) Transcript_1306:375-662(-)